MSLAIACAGACDIVTLQSHRLQIRILHCVERAVSAWLIASEGKSH